MKNNFITYYLFILCIGCFSNNTDSKKIIGAWRNDRSTTLIFLDNTRIIEVSKEFVTSGTYKRIGQDTMIFNYVVNENPLKLPFNMLSDTSFRVNFLTEDTFVKVADFSWKW